MELLVGGNGHLGRRIAVHLRSRGRAPAVLLRPSVDEAAVTALGATAVAGDLRDPASIDAACVGVERVVVTANALLPRGRDTSVELGRQLPYLFDACEREDVSHVVLVSPPVGPFDDDCPHVAARRGAEAALAASGIGHSIVRLAPLTEFWLAMGGLEGVATSPSLSRGQALLATASKACRVSTERSGSFRVFGDASQEHPLLSADDAAAAITAVALGEPRGVVEVAGPERRPWRSVAVAVAEHLDRRIEITEITSRELRGAAGFIRRPSGATRAASGLLTFLRALSAARIDDRATDGIPTPTRRVEDVLAVARGVRSPRDERG